MQEDLLKKEEENNKSTSTKKLEKDLEGKLTECEKEKKAYLDGWKRAKADFINYKKINTAIMHNSFIAHNTFFNFISFYACTM